MGLEIAHPLKEWYRSNRRDLAFRRTRDPYAILVAEAMLQRTRIVTGVPYYERFLARFPTVADLANASEEEVLRAWEGLGFYGRARNLHRAARLILSDHGGRVPERVSALRTLPGVGDYTAGAVASIAFGVPVPAIDGNATRVLARVFRLRGDLSRSEGRRRLQAIAESLVPATEPGTYNQALMELGATVCLPRAPKCPACPIRSMCGAFAEGRVEAYPTIRRTTTVPTVRVAFALIERRGKVLLMQRPARGVLAMFWSLPGGELGTHADEATGLQDLFRSRGLPVRIAEPLARVDHTFSHRRWKGLMLRGHPAGTIRDREDLMWASPEDIERLPVVSFQRRFLEGVAILPHALRRLGGTERGTPRKAF